MSEGFAGAGRAGPVRRRGRSARTLLLVASVVGLLSIAPSVALAASHHVHVQRTQQLAVLLSSHRAHAAPRAGARVLVNVPELRPITGERTTLPVIGHARGRDGIPWLHVLLPGRPNGAAGWIAAQGTRASVTSWHLFVSLDERRVRVYRDGRLLRTFGAVVGKPSTPTPTGRFFVEETLQMSPGEPGGPFALATSGRSDVLQEFEGGPGQIALHGRGDLGGTLGEAESHGCVRLATASIDWLAERIGPGVPVTISDH